MDKIFINQKGMIAIITLMGVSVVTLAIMSTMAILAMGEIKMAQSGGAIDNTFYAAEAGLNEALYRLIKNPIPKVYAFEINGISVSTEIKPNPANPYQRIVESQAISKDGKVRTVRVMANTNSWAGGFDYAVQGGTNGIYMDNNSVVEGDVYCNGNISGTSGAPKGEIQGDAWVALTSVIDRVLVTGDADGAEVFAHQIIDSRITGDAYFSDYSNIDVATEVNGVSCFPSGTNPNCHSGEPDQPIEDMPISSTDITNWIADISALGKPVLSADPSTCPPSHPVGYYCLTDGDIIGDQQIDSNLYMEIGNGGTLTITGNLYVTGKIEMQNNGTVIYNPQHASLPEEEKKPMESSLVLIGDGKIEVSNNAAILASGSPGSFVLILSQNDSLDESDPAIYSSNNSDSIIFSSLNGVLKVKNGSKINAAASKKLYLEPNSHVIFDPLIKNFTVMPGSAEAITGENETWQEL